MCFSLFDRLQQWQWWDCVRLCPRLASLSRAFPDFISEYSLSYLHKKSNKSILVLCLGVITVLEFIDVCFIKKRERQLLLKINHIRVLNATFPKKDTNKRIDIYISYLSFSPRGTFKLLKEIISIKSLKNLYRNNSTFMIILHINLTCN